MPEANGRWLVLLATAAVAALPLSLVTHPPLTDLPFHAAFTSILAHHGDPRFHFAEQFQLQAAAPQLLFYAVAAALAQALPLDVAVRVTTALALSCLPLGVWVLRRALGKEGWPALLAVGLVWNTATHWGFVSFVAATGLSLVVLAATIRLARRAAAGPVAAPTRVALALLALLVFFAHPQRAAFLLVVGPLVAFVVGRGAALRTALPSLLPLAGGVAVAVAARPETQSTWTELGLHPGRATEFAQHLFEGYRAEAPSGRLERWGFLLLLAAAAVTLLLARRGREREEPARNAATISPGCLLAAALVHAVAYFTLPMTLGEWWWVYPREVLPLALLGVSALPDPPGGWRTHVAAGAMTASLVLPGALAVRDARGFHRVTADFRSVAARVPPAPRLLVLVFDHRGSERRRSPFLHLPAWIQAERGGWLSFHFAAWGFYPFRYRPGGDVPPEPVRVGEHRPQDFHMERHGAWYDAFLVRHERDPGVLFAADPGVRLAAHQGTWWLYLRRP